MTRESYEKSPASYGDIRRHLAGMPVQPHPDRLYFRAVPGVSAAAFSRGQHFFFLRALLVPAVSFAAVTVFRRIFNAPRPYEKFGLPPAIEKDTAGKSFPSRHVFSVFIIAATIFYVHPSAGILLGLLGVVLAVLRVIGGVHEPRDVIAGALAGILCGVLGYYVL